MLNMLNAANLLRRGLLSPLRPSATPTAAPLSFTRNESNTRRHTKRLRLPPHPDFKYSDQAPSLTHILYNPPAAAPSVYATPALFLPKDDPRRALRSTPPPETKLPPPVTEIKEKKYHLTPKDFARMRSLRASNPKVWTRGKLAEEFGTSRFFAGMIAEADDKRKEKMKEKLEKVMQRWGPRKTNARVDRARRRKGWGVADRY